MSSTTTINEQELFKNIFAHAYNGIALVSLEGAFLQVNNSLCRILGYTATQLKELTFQKLTYTDDLEKDLEYLQQLLAGDIENYQMEKRYYHKSGTLVWGLLSVSLVTDANQKPLHFVSQIIDITKRKTSEKESEAFLTLLEAQNGKFKDFLDIVSHDLRTHTGNITTLTNFIEEDHPTVAKDESFSLLKTAVLNLNETLLSLNETIQSNALQKKNLQKISLYEIANKALENVNAIAKINDCTLKNNIPENLYVYAETTYLNSILINLISNAIKYRHPNRKCLVELIAEEKEHFLVFSVKDNGLGLDLDAYSEDLFKPYTTFHDVADARGVGLYITKKYVEFLGGTIGVESNFNLGSTFTIKLPKVTQKSK